MASKSNLKKEMHTLNKELDKHLSSAKIDSFDEDMFDLNSQDSGSSDIFLISQALKDIRMEMNLMRKHLISDVGNLIKETLFENQKSLQKDLKSFYNQSYQVFKNYDPSVLKAVIEEVGRVTKNQEDLKNQINELNSDYSKNFSTLSKEISNTSLFYEGALKSLSKSFETSEKNLNKDFKSLQSHISTQQKNHVKELKHFEKSYVKLITSVEHKFLGSQQKLLEQTKNISVESKIPVNFDSTSTLPMDDFSENIQNEELEILQPFPSEKRIHKLLDIDERLKKLSALK